MNLDAWLADVNGHFIDRDYGFPARDPYQCWDLSADFMNRVVGVPIAATYTNYGAPAPHPGYACNVFHNAKRVAAIVERFTVVGPGERAHAGDVAFWDITTAYPGSHTAVVARTETGRDTGYGYFMSQNKGAGLDRAAFETLTKSGLLGYLRPITDPSKDDPRGDDMPTAKEITQYLLNQHRFRDGLTVGQTLVATRKSSERAEAFAAQAAASAAAAAAKAPFLFYKHGGLSGKHVLWIVLFPPTASSAGRVIRIRDLATAQKYKELNGGVQATVVSGAALREIVAQVEADGDEVQYLTAVSGSASETTATTDEEIQADAIAEAEAEE